jgi:transposase
LSKADLAKRVAFIAEFQTLYERMCRGEIRLLYLDESHFHQDLDLGYTWALASQPAWRKSLCPPLSARLNWYGAYDFSEGRCLIWHEGHCNSDHTICFLARLAAWLNESTRQVVIIWDGAPWHRSRKVQAKAQALGFLLVPLPGYSPDLNPIERLWQWMREDVTQLFCHESLKHLFDDCLAFIRRINLDPEQLIARLWPKFDLDPDFEKFALSN